MKALILAAICLTACSTQPQGHTFHITSVSTYVEAITPTNDFKTLSQWQGVLNRQPIAASQAKPSYATLSAINMEVNFKPYKINPNWPTPKEFAASPTADCKGFTLSKYYALRRAGWKANEVNIWSGDYQGRSHMLLVAKLEANSYVLDIGSESNLPLAKDYFYHNFVPSYRFNETGWETR